MTARFLFTAFATIALVACCPDSQSSHPINKPVAPKPLGSTINYPVTLHISGIVHLLGSKGDKTRLLIVPNLTAANPRHAPLLLATADYQPYGLGKKRVQTLPDLSTVTYLYTELTPGLELDLVTSGIYKQNFLDLDETDKDAAGKPAECPDPPYAKRRSLYWLPRLSKVSGVSFNVKSASSKKDPSPADVVTRMEIVDGSLDVLPGADKFVFAVNGKTKQTQAVATELQYTFLAALDASTPVFTLWGRQFKKNSNDPDQPPVEIARFVPYNGKIEIVIANVVEDDFFKPMTMAYLPHFDLSYSVVSRFFGVPIATATRGDKCGGGVGGTIECGPTQIP